MSLEVEIEADVAPIEEVVSVEFFVDGRFVGRLQAPPYRLRANVRHENVEHRFEVLAFDLSGETGQSQVITPKLRVDLQLDLQLQQLYVTVSRERQRVLDLMREEFVVVDAGERQTLVTFERGDVPMAALLMVDASDSMQGRPLAAALRGAQAFIRGMQPLDQAKLLLFSDHVVHTSPFTGFTNVLTAGLQGVAASGGTALNDHLYLALKLLEMRQGRRVIVLLTDGFDIASVLAMQDVLWVARRSRALVYWIRLGRPNPGQLRYSAWRDAQQHREELAGLEELVEQSGGRVEILTSIDDTEAAFASILQELRDQYVLGFYPTHSTGDGSWHRVRVRVKRSGLSVRTREGYLDY